MTIKKSYVDTPHRQVHYRCSDAREGSPGFATTVSPTPIASSFEPAEPSVAQYEGTPHEH